MNADKSDTKSTMATIHYILSTLVSISSDIKARVLCPNDYLSDRKREKNSVSNEPLKTLAQYTKLRKILDDGDKQHFILFFFGLTKLFTLYLERNLLSFEK